MSEPPVNREFELVAACCRWPPSADRNARIGAIAAASIDWPRLRRIADRHRVYGLVWNGLQQAGVAAPPEIAAALHASAARSVVASLRQAAESLRLQKLFDAAGIRCAFLKGVSLAVLGFGNAGLRHAKDVDLLVPAADLTSACELLRRAGYRQIHPAAALSEAQWALWRRYDKDITWRQSSTGIELELHWRSSVHPALLPAAPDFTALQPVALNGADAVMTLSSPELCHYLCVHGATHGWCRLKWLADVNALLAGLPDEMLRGLYRSGQNGPRRRAVGQALLLCRDFLGLRLPPDLETDLRGSRAVRMLVRIGRASILRGGAETEIYDQRFGTSLIAASYLLLPGTLRGGLAVAWRLGLNLDDAFALGLPPQWGPLVRLLRVPLWVRRRVQHAGASRRAGATGGSRFRAP